MIVGHCYLNISKRKNKFIARLPFQRLFQFSINSHFAFIVSSWLQFGNKFNNKNYFLKEGNNAASNQLIAWIA
ncbi:hypothetical protein X975_02884, partial [Stegodyphus mimosarum]